MRFTFSLFVLLSLLCQIMAKKSKLIFVQSISRHGTRYPMRPQQYDGIWFVHQQHITGEITNEGKHQQYVLGKILYAKYWKKLFAGTKYENQYHQSQILVRSTSKNRTLDSMEALIVGLLQALPPKMLPKSQRQRALPAFLNAADYDVQSEGEENFYVFGKKHKYFQTLSIHGEKQEVNSPRGLKYTTFATPYDEGDFLHKYLDQNCPNQRGWVTANLASQKVRKVLESKPIKKFFQQLGNQTKHQVDFDLVDDHIDDYRTLKNMGLPYLPFFDQPQNQRTAQFLAEYHFQARLMMTQTQIQVCTAILLDTTANNMRKAATGEGPKFVLYSSHETTMICLLSALKLTSVDCIVERYFHPSTKRDEEPCIDTIPMFGATIIFELYLNQDQSLAFKLLYNGIPIKIPVCGNKILCPLEEFEEWNQKFSPTDPNILCGIQKAPQTSPVDVPWAEIDKIEIKIDEISKKTRANSLQTNNYQQNSITYLTKS